MPARKTIGKDMKYRDHRWPTDGSVQVFSETGRSIVNIKNVGRLGLGLVGEAGFRKGQTVKLLIAGKPYEATIQWARGQGCGVRLTAELGDAELAILRKLSGKQLLRHQPQRPGWTAGRFSEL